MGEQCPLCDRDATHTPIWAEPSSTDVKCDVCRSFRISDGAIAEVQQIQGPYAERRYLLSGLTRRRSDSGSRVTITTENLPQLFDGLTPPETPQDVLDQLLVHLADNATTFFQAKAIDPNLDYPIARARSPGELEGTFLFGKQTAVIAGSLSTATLTPRGWDRVIELRRVQARTRQAFVAMSFVPELKHVWKEGFEPALLDVGYQPLRVDQEEFNDKIDDEIVKQIRSSGLLVADFTGHRCGVYFEAGFAFGLGIPFIWTCRDDTIGDSHFDTRQYNHVVWTEPADLKEKLMNRIEATLPDRFK